jgi:hypothetical protein
MLEGLADALREGAHGNDDVTAALLRRAAMQFNERAGELRSRSHAPVESEDVSLFEDPEPAA